MSSDTKFAVNSSVSFSEFTDPLFHGFIVFLKCSRSKYLIFNHEIELRLTAAGVYLRIGYDSISTFFCGHFSTEYLIPYVAVSNRDSTNEHFTTLG